MLRHVRMPIAVLLVAMGTVAGCRGIETPTGLLEQSAPTGNFNSKKLRILLTDYVPRFADRVEQTADEILSQTSDPQIRRNALLWKSNAISACFCAAARPDPLAAFLDVQILSRQMTQFFERSDVEPALGRWQRLAVDASRDLELPLTQIGDMLDLPSSFDERFVAAFANEHPLTGLYFDRASLAAPFINDLQAPTRDTLDVVAQVSDNLNEMQRLSALYAEFLPKQARWQAELLLLAAVQNNGPLARPLESLTVASQAMDRLAATGESVPGLLERERRALHEIVHEERTETMAEIETMRGATLMAMTLQCTTMLGAVQEERRALNRDFDATVVRAIDKIDGLVARRGGELSQVAERVAERLWHRALQLALLIGLLVFAVLGGVVLCLRRGLFHRRRPVSIEPSDDVVVPLPQRGNTRTAAA
jgi:hypothetical protein